MQTQSRHFPLLSAILYFFSHSLIVPPQGRQGTPNGRKAGSRVSRSQQAHLEQLESKLQEVKQKNQLLSISLTQKQEELDVRARNKIVTLFIRLGFHQIMFFS